MVSVTVLSAEAVWTPPKVNSNNITKKSRRNTSILQRKFAGDKIRYVVSGPGSADRMPDQFIMLFRRLDTAILDLDQVAKGKAGVQREFGEADLVLFPELTQRLIHSATFRANFASATRRDDGGL